MEQEVTADGPAGQPADSASHSSRFESGETLRNAVATVSPSVVTIETVGGTQPVSPTSGPARPAGFILADGPTTGLVYSSDGLILTSTFNFLRNPTVITVVLADGRRLVAELLARDELRKLAMLKVPARELPVPSWRPESESPVVGQRAIALGRGFGGSDCTMNVGIISGINRMSGLAIQTDARLSPANFGGPLIDLDGRVIGICVPMGMGDDPVAGIEWYDSGIGFAIPGAQVRPSAEHLALGHNLRPGLLGVRLDPKPAGALRILEVANPSPAMRVGIRPGDEILAIAGHTVDGMQDLRRVMRARRAGEPIDVRVRRGGEEIDVRIVPAVPEDLGPLSPPASQPGFAQPMVP